MEIPIPGKVSLCWDGAQVSSLQETLDAHVTLTGVLWANGTETVSTLLALCEEFIGYQ